MLIFRDTHGVITNLQDTGWESDHFSSPTQGHNWPFRCLDLTISLLTTSFCWRKKVFSKIIRLKIDIYYKALIQSTSLLWCFHKELIQCSLIWRFHNPYSFRACPRLSNEGWIFWIRFCNDLRVAPCVSARGPLYSQIWHHSKVFPFTFAAVKH